MGSKVDMVLPFESSGSSSANLQLLDMSANFWVPTSATRRKGQTGIVSPEPVDRKSINEEGGRTLILVVRLAFEHATDRAAWRKMEAAPAARTSDDRMKKSLNEHKGSEEAAAHASYAAQKVTRLGLGLTMFLGELFRLQAITECIIHERANKLSCDVKHLGKRSLRVYASYCR
ncbi:hypothetical protein DFJ58DRAFT_730477 [Suillus subalutaceus]|uniref:uncharacterized protein n=1 Tax=Suillus subalutaceus TaxID=48586 RepID=UPI001B87EE6F|nr:uncharacterized protein DFJ58DRAFT_730477 [Suillus subalutaceus]KAG1846590.1 hypothetical protein DFJ58DRAFT_730477 [Suillus subalutaceus]